jgi:hypothetical protein
MFLESTSKAYLPVTIYENPIAVSTPQATYATRKIITRKIRMILDL